MKTYTPKSVTTAQATIPHSFHERLAKLETEHKHITETQTEILKRLTDLARTTRRDMTRLQAEIHTARMEITQSREISRKETEHLQKQMLTHEHMTGFQKENHEKLAEMQKENHEKLAEMQRESRKEMADFQRESRKEMAELQEKNHKNMLQLQEAAHKRETHLMLWIVGTGAVLLIAILGTFFAPQHLRSSQHGLEPSATDTEVVSLRGEHRPRET